MTAGQPTDLVGLGAALQASDSVAALMDVLLDSPLCSGAAAARR